MTISKYHNADNCYAWIWLPGETSPVTAGKLVYKNAKYSFTYGQHYRQLERAISFSPFELPLKAGTFTPPGISPMHSPLRDASPDAWGRRLIQYQHPDIIPNEIDYLLLSGSDRVGALDFQSSPDHYEARGQSHPTLDCIPQFADIAEKENDITKTLAPLLLHGTSIGGARPKCFIEYQQATHIAKFSLSTDLYPIIKAESIAMQLAKHIGLDAATTCFHHVLDRDVLLIKRFDRKQTPSGATRNFMLSALSLLQLDEMEARYASYIDLAHIIRQHFTSPTKTLKELFQRLVFNILIGNTDDHARNHAAFWDGKALTLTPAYDLCPQLRAGQEATQAMAINGNEGNFSTLSNALSVCHHFLLETNTAKNLIQRQIDLLESHWLEMCESVSLSNREKNQLWGTVIRSEYALQGW